MWVGKGLNDQTSERPGRGTEGADRERGHGGDDENDDDSRM